MLKLTEEFKNCALSRLKKGNLGEGKCRALSEDLTKDTPSQNSCLTESSNDSEASFLRLENEILAEQLRDKLFTYKLSNSAHLNERRSISISIKQCKDQFSGIQDSVQDILNNTKLTKKQIRDLERQYLTFDNLDESQPSTENTQKNFMNQLKSIQNQILQFDSRVSLCEEKLVHTEKQDFDIKAQLELIEKLALEKEAKGVTCTLCNIF